MIILRISELALWGSPSLFSHRNPNGYSAMLPLKDNDAYLMQKKKKKKPSVLIIYLLNLDGIGKRVAHLAHPHFRKPSGNMSSNSFSPYVFGFGVLFHFKTTGKIPLLLAVNTCIPCLTEPLLSHLREKPGVHSRKQLTCLWPFPGSLPANISSRHFPPTYFI